MVKPLSRRRITFYGWCVVLGAASLARTDGRNLDAPESEVVAAAALSNVGYGILWTLDLQLPPRDPVAALYLLDENLYVMTRGGVTHAVQADTGLLRWSYALDEPRFVERAPAHLSGPDGAGLVVLVTTARAVLLDRYGGSVVRIGALPFVASGSAAADGERLYLGGADGKIHALLWRCAPGGSPLHAWQAAVEGRAVSAPVMAFSDALYFATDQGTVYSTARVQPRLFWRFRTGGPVSDGLSVDESGVYVASADHKLYVLHPDRGSPVQTYLLPGPLRTAPIVAHRTVYQYCEAEGVFAFDTDTRHPLWINARASTYVAGDPDRAVLRLASGGLSVVNRDDGRELQQLELPKSIRIARNLRDSVLVLSSPDGRVVCARPLRFPYLRRETVAAAAAVLRQQPVRRAADAAADAKTIEAKAGSDDEQDPLRSRIPRP